MTKEKEKIFEIIDILDRIRLQQEFYKKLWPKAEWIDGSCSFCGKEAITKWTETGGKMIYTNFCPNCGSDMRGKWNDKRRSD